MTEAASSKKRTVAQKLFLNERDEVSFRKVGVFCGALGVFLVSGGIPGVAVAAAVGKAATALGVFLTAMGQLEKNDRVRDE